MCVRAHTYACVHVPRACECARNGETVKKQLQGVSMPAIASKAGEVMAHQ